MARLLSYLGLQKITNFPLPQLQTRSHVYSVTGNLALIQKLLPVCENSYDYAQQELKWLSLHVVNNLRQQGHLREKDSVSSNSNDCYDNHPQTTDEAWKIMSLEEKEVLSALVRQRVEQSKPLQYILGTQPFLDLEIITRPPVLIPRWETEEWTSYLINLLNSHLDAPKRKPRLPFKILDICTGSGCIGLALAHNLTHNTCTIHAIDNAPDALLLAQKNISVHNPHNRVILSNLDIMKSISNPPYVTRAEYETLSNEIKLWEDKRALVADNEDGTAFHQRIAKLALGLPLLRKQDIETTKIETLPRVVMEIGGENQVKIVKEALYENGFGWVKVWKDAAGKDRCVIAGTLFSK
ncbi:5471_t:CDS:2 [Ambispora gerdemannii]|uniref:peptide chain release factor N(5)-glutamine methyltransferase n=1 Tax=Ambispora gerdemannii TaxID=144530 RepID=A0A9N8ZMS7_9GLOM|nr:5471_t:CDS:2 [Ambispora gerdemannii]